MSVRAPERNESPLDVQVKCNELVRHTVHICSNERYFDPKYAQFTGKIVNTAIDVGLSLWKANGVYVGDDPLKWKERRYYQRKACADLDALLYLMNVARTLYHLRERKYTYWVGLARETRDLARKWRDSDARRHRHLESGMSAV